jgi:hypothetical protein
LDCCGQEKHVQLARVLLVAIDAYQRSGEEGPRDTLLEALAKLLHRNIALMQSDVTFLLLIITSMQLTGSKLALLRVALDTIKRVIGSRELTRDQRQMLVALRQQLLQIDKKGRPAAAKLATEIDSLCNELASARLHLDEGWADDLRCWLDTQTPLVRGQWDALLRDAAAVEPAPPAKEWKVGTDEIPVPREEDEVAALVRVAGNGDEIPDDEKYEVADLEIGSPEWEAAWEAHYEACHRLQLERLPCSEWKETMAGHLRVLEPERVAERVCHCLRKVPDSKPGMLARESLNREMLRGLLYLCCDLPATEMADAVARATRFFFQNNSPLKETGVIVLYHLATRASIGALASVEQIVTGRLQRGFVRFARVSLAQRLGLDPDDLGSEELPTFGFTGLGELRKEFGDVQAKLSITGSRTPEIAWSRKGGKILKTIPASVKREHQGEIEALKATAKEVRGFLAGFAGRIESTWLGQGKFSVESWRRQLIDHVVAGVIGSKLIWKFVNAESATVAYWRDKGLVDSSGGAVPLPAAGWVELYHPLGAGMEEVLAWRERLEADSVTQPFKQAHREVYLLTDAERRTRTYSNRFAAHIIWQAQFRKLAKIRGWQSPLVGPWDGGDRQAAERKLPRWGLRAEFWVSAAGTDDLHYTGCNYLATDQVRFYRHEPGSAISEEPLPLETIPPLVFTEVMRDVDLFVGVASLGNDPNWADGGPDGRYREYWQGYSFGDLSATAQTRKDVLERLVPRLKIADRCSFADRWLVVRGDLRTYKIHLGSGNILMAPNDQYLCIVPKQTTAVGKEQVFLPFEGDSLLSIILSKALMLAEDEKIKDETIRRQIRL